jgi:hypothetical protein
MINHFTNMQVKFNFNKLKFNLHMCEVIYHMLIYLVKLFLKNYNHLNDIQNILLKVYNRSQ